MLLFTVAADEQRPPPHVDAPPHRQAALYRVAERPAVQLVDQREDLADATARGGAALGPRHHLRRAVHVIDAPLVVGRDDALGDRFQRVLCLALAAAQADFEALAIAHVPRDGQDRLPAAVLDQRGLRLHPEPLLFAVDELDLETLGDVLAGKAPGDVVAEQRAIRRLDQVGDLAALELPGLEPYQGRRA